MGIIKISCVNMGQLKKMLFDAMFWTDQGIQEHQEDQYLLSDQDCQEDQGSPDVKEIKIIKSGLMIIIKINKCRSQNFLAFMKIKSQNYLTGNPGLPISPFCPVKPGWPGAPGIPFSPLTPPLPGGPRGPSGPGGPS